MSGTALPTAGRFRFVASDRTSRPWITLFVLRGVHVTGSGSNLQLLATNEATAAFYKSLGYSVEPRLSMGKVLHTNASDRSGASVREEPG